MTNEEMNAIADRIAAQVKAAAEAGQSPDDLRDLVFVNVKAELAKAVTP